jgi:hypothetical protein
MTVRIRVWVLEATFLGLLLVLSWTLPMHAQRSAVSPSVRLAIAEATAETTAAIAAISTELAVVQKTAAAAHEELIELRRAIWGMAVAILVSLATQILSTRKARNSP